VDESREILDADDHVVGEVETAEVVEPLKGLDAVYLFGFGGAEVQGLGLIGLVSRQMLYSYHLNINNTGQFPSLAKIIKGIMF
jgi:hypothetical protein